MACLIGHRETDLPKTGAPGCAQDACPNRLRRRLLLQVAQYRHSYRSPVLRQGEKHPYAVRQSRADAHHLDRTGASPGRQGIRPARAQKNSMCPSIAGKAPVSNPAAADIARETG